MANKITKNNQTHYQKNNQTYYKKNKKYKKHQTILPKSN